MLSLIFKEINHRKFNFILSALAAITAVALIVAFFTMSSASNRETIRLTRDMGFNLRIIPKDTDMDDFWMTGYSKITMPEDYVLKFKEFKDFSYAHLTVTLNERITWRDKNIILTGLTLKEIEPSGRQKAPMIFLIKPGTVHIGFDLANTFHIKAGDDIDILGTSFKVARTMPENGSDDDIRIFAQLPDVQDILNKKGKINEIKALNCLCLTDGETDPLIVLRKQLDQVLPDAKVVMNKTIAVARERQRVMFEKYFAFVLPLIIIVCAAWIGTLAMLNVKDRKQEIGILRALGYGANKVAILFLGKAALIGIVGAVLGFIIGTMLSLTYGPDIFKITARSIKAIYSLLWWAIFIAPIFAALSAFIPSMIAVTQDPASTLTED